MGRRIDLNADMGESFGRWTLGDDDALMPFLSSANIACGFHGGDAHQMRATCALAVEHGVGIGAHVAVPDLIGFGRRRLAVTPQELEDYVLYQAGALAAFARAAGGTLQHVKPHGILYSMCKEDPELAAAVCSATRAVGEGVILLLSGDTVRDACAVAGVPFVPEGYVDLDYDGDGRLVLERVKRVRDPDEMGRRAVRLVTERAVATLAGTDLPLHVDSICVHGDAPNAPQVAAAIRRDLATAGVTVAPLAAFV